MSTEAPLGSNLGIRERNAEKSSSDLSRKTINFNQKRLSIENNEIEKIDGQEIKLNSLPSIGVFKEFLIIEDFQSSIGSSACNNVSSVGTTH